MELTLIKYTIDTHQSRIEQVIRTTHIKQKSVIKDPNLLMSLFPELLLWFYSSSPSPLFLSNIGSLRKISMFFLLTI